MAAAAAGDSDSWDADTFSVEDPVRKVAGGGTAGGDRWEDEDEDEDVKLEEPEEPRVLTPEQLADKLRLKKLQEESDLELEKETFGVNNTVCGIDAMNPSSRDAFTEFGKLLKDKITQYEKSLYYASFLEALVRDVCISLEIDDLEKITNSLTVLCSGKQKQEKQSQKEESGHAALLPGAPQLPHGKAEAEERAPSSSRSWWLLGSPSAPTLFPLVSCVSPLSDENPVALGCLARDFLPSSISFSWSYQNDSEVSGRSVQSFPAVLREGKYAASSQVLLPPSSVPQGSEEHLLCRVQHLNSNKVVAVPVRPTDPKPPLSPNVSVFIPPRDAFSGTPQRTSRLICQATDFRPKQISLSWFREGKRVVSGISEGPVETVQSSPVTFRTYSMLTITESDWLSQSVFTCEVEHNEMTFQKNVSSVCGPIPDTPIRIFTIPPSFADIFLTKSAKLSCLVTDLTTYDSLSISWTRQDGKVLQTRTNISESHPNGTFSAVGETSVCVEDWESGEGFTCTVTHTDLPSPLKRSISRPKGKPALASFPPPRALPRLLGSEDNEAGPGEPLRSPLSRTDPSRPQPDLTTVSPPAEVAKHMPSVYVLPPTREQLSLRESASVTCLVKGFSPADVFVQWLQKGQPMSSDKYVTSAPAPEPQAPGLYFVHSILTVSEEDWNSGETYTCVVGHEALPHMVTERTVDKSTGKPTLYNVSLVMSDTASTCY
eukprot:bmy_22103T0